MKKLLISLVLLLLLSVPSQAADSLYRMLHADEVESFKEAQDAIILLQVTDVQEYHLTAEVLYTISGQVDGTVINLDNEIRFLGRTGKKVQIGDYYVISVKKYGDFYKQAWAALQADSGDYKTLKFYYDSHFSDIDALQWYVNSGGVDKDFFFESTKVFVRQTDGTKLEITLSRTPYLPSGDKKVEVYTKEAEPMVNEEVKAADQVVKEKPNTLLANIVMAVFMAVAILMGFLIGKLVRSKDGYKVRSTSAARKMANK